MIPKASYHMEVVEQAIGSVGVDTDSAEPSDYSQTPSGQGFIYHNVTAQVAITVRTLYMARGEDVDVCYDEDTGTMSVQVEPDFDEEN